MIYILPNIRKDMSGLVSPSVCDDGASAVLQKQTKTELHLQLDLFTLNVPTMNGTT